MARSVGLSVAVWRQFARWTLVLMALIWVAPIDPALSAGWNPMPLEERVSKSTIVIVGRIEALEPIQDARAEVEHAVVAVEIALKGSPPKTIRVLSRGYLSEETPDCCIIGKRYLLFLTIDPDGIYSSVDGRFGMYRVDQ